MVSLVSKSGSLVVTTFSRPTWICDRLRATISVCYQPPRSTQPAHPSVGRRNEWAYQRKLGVNRNAHNTIVREYVFSFFTKSKNVTFYVFLSDMSKKHRKRFPSFRIMTLLTLFSTLIRYLSDCYKIGYFPKCN